MIGYQEIKGKYNTAYVHAKIIDELSIKQLEELCNQEFCQSSNIAVMLDVHVGVSCVIGTP